MEKRENMRIVITVMIVLAAATMVAAAEESCPSTHAAKAGISQFEEFHSVMAPVWHGAYPDSNFDAMLAAGPEFTRTFKSIATIEADMKSVARKAAFLTNRERFAALVKRYAAACAAGNKDSVYIIMPDLHDAFELTASACLPIAYPELEGITVTVNLILTNHLPKSNTEGIIGSTETLVTKCAGLTAKSIPEELRPHEKQIIAEFETITALAGQLQQCCDKNDMTKYRSLANDLHAKLAAFDATYR